MSPSQHMVLDTVGATASLQKKVRAKRNSGSEALLAAEYRLESYAHLQPCQKVSTFMSSLQPPMPYIATMFPSPITTSSLLPLPQFSPNL